MPDVRTLHPPFVSASWLHEQIVRHADQHSTSGVIVAVHVENYASLLEEHSAVVLDVFMAELWQCVVARLPPGTEVSAIGMDGWALWIPSVPPHSAQAQAEAIEQFIEYYCLDRQPSVLSTPIYLCLYLGAIGYPMFSLSSSVLLDKAFIAMRYGQYSRHYGVHLYHQDKTISGQGIMPKDQTSMLYELHKALAEKRLRVAYQPIVLANSCQPSYWECLLRIQQSDGTYISAGPYVEVAESSGLIEDIDRFVLEQAVAELETYPQIMLAVNVSAKLLDPKGPWMKHCETLLWGQKPLAKRLIVEITETAFEQDQQHTEAFLDALHKLGCRVALDDFGSGYTSFRQLKNLSFDILKIDGSYIRDIGSNTDNQLLVKVIVEICKGFGLVSVAEFVENEAVAQKVVQLGIDYLQGYFYSPAIIDPPWRHQPLPSERTPVRTMPESPNPKTLPL